MRSKYSINLRDGSRVFRTLATDELTALYNWIPDEVAHEIDIGKLDAMSVVNAIMKKRMEKGDFDWAKYQAERKKLNIREQPIDLSELEENRAAEAVPDNPDDSVLLEELKGGAQEQPPVEEPQPPKSLAEESEAPELPAEEPQPPELPAEEPQPPDQKELKAPKPSAKGGRKNDSKKSAKKEVPAEPETPPMPSADDGAEVVDA